MTHSVNASFGNRGRAVAAAKTFDLPGKSRTILRPYLQQTSLSGNGVPIGTLPLRPIIGSERTRQKSRRKHNQNKFTSNHNKSLRIDLRVKVTGGKSTMNPQTFLIFSALGVRIVQSAHFTDPAAIWGKC